MTKFKRKPINIFRGIESHVAKVGLQVNEKKTELMRYGKDIKRVNQNLTIDEYNFEEVLYGFGETRQMMNLQLLLEMKKEDIVRMIKGPKTAINEK